MKTNTLIGLSAVLIMSLGCATTTDLAEENTAMPKKEMAMASMSKDGMPMMKMQEKMKLMKTQMAEIHQTEDLDKRDALLKSHRESMHEMMGMMQGMHGDKPMMGKGQMEGKTSERKMGECKMMDGKMKMHTEHMNMMQMMMQHMKMNQDATEKSMMMHEKKMQH